MEKIHGWMAKKKSVWIAGTEFYVISYAGWSLEIILYTVFDQDSALEKYLSSIEPVLSPNKQSQVLLLPLDVMVITEKDSVVNGKDQRLIIAVSVMFIHFQVSDHSLIIF